MHETDDRKRWLDLFDDLGLEPESPSAPPAPVVKATPEVVVAEPVAPAPVEPVAEVAAEPAPAPRTRRKKAAATAAPEGEIEKEPTSRVRRKRRVAKTDDAAEEAPAVAADLAPVAEAEMTIEPPLDAPTFVAPEPEPATMLEETESEGDEPLDSDAEAAPNGEDAAKGTRRRRRRRRRKPSDASEDAAVQPVVAGRTIVESALEDSEDEATTAPVFAREIGSDEDEEVSETPPALEEDIEFEDLTNLDMPSWSELVGSLYRPPDR